MLILHSVCEHMLGLRMKPPVNTYSVPQVIHFRMELIILYTSQNILSVAVVVSKLQIKKCTQRVNPIPEMQLFIKLKDGLKFDSFHQVIPSSFYPDKEEGVTRKDYIITLSSHQTGHFQTCVSQFIAYFLLIIPTKNHISPNSQR